MVSERWVLYRICGDNALMDFIYGDNHPLGTSFDWWVRAIITALHPPVVQ